MTTDECFNCGSNIKAAKRYTVTVTHYDGFEFKWVVVRRYCEECYDKSIIKGEDDGN